MTADELIRQSIVEDREVSAEYTDELAEALFYAALGDHDEHPNGACASSCGLERYCGTVDGRTWLVRLDFER